MICQGQTTKANAKNVIWMRKRRLIENCFLEHKRPRSTRSEVSNNIHIESLDHHNMTNMAEVKILVRLRTSLV